MERTQIGYPKQQLENVFLRILNQTSFSPEIAPIAVRRVLNYEPEGTSLFADDELMDIANKVENDSTVLVLELQSLLNEHPKPDELQQFAERFIQELCGRYSRK